MNFPKKNFKLFSIFIKTFLKNVYQDSLQDQDFSLILIWSKEQNRGIRKVKISVNYIVIHIILSQML